MLDEKEINRKRNFIQQLNGMYSSKNLETRAENAFGVAVKFYELLEQNVTDEEDLNKILNAWFRGIKAKNYKKFQRIFAKYYYGDSGDETGA